jgi:hypothetical protein
MPLNPGRHSELHCDLAHAHAALLQGRADIGLSLSPDPRPTDRLAAVGAVSGSPGHSCQHPLPDHRALEFGKHAHHLEHGLARRGRRVETLLVQVEIDVLGVELGQQLQQPR